MNIDKFPDEIRLEESGYGSGHHTVIVLTSESRGALKKYIAQHKYRRIHEADRPGEVFAHGLRCLSYVKGDNNWQAVCVSSTYWDV